MNDNTSVKVTPGPMIDFILSVCMWMFACAYLGLFGGDCYLLYGAVLVISLPFWVKAANMSYNIGNPIMGHFYLVFGIMLAGFAGVSYIVLYFSHVFPELVMDERILGVLFLIAGLFLIPTLPSMLYMDKVNMVTWTVCTIWYIFGGISYFVPNVMFLYMVSVVCCLIASFGVTYMMLNEAVLMCYGKPLPMGKPVKNYDNHDK